jgi:Asp-tRNA(Asn)/Glu-tRNA(Gln) amidotransferase A subunit family amidase
VTPLARAYRERRVTPTEIVSRALRAAADFEPLNAFIRLDADGPHAEAEASTARWAAGAPLSPLDGVPVAVKDQIDVAGMPTTGGTSFLRRPAERDAGVIARLRAAGAIPFGKTNLPELALAPTGINPHHGTVRNPHRPSHDTGGSSSGSAVAVASGVVPMALGTDLGGSLRIPAALCGIASLKPSFDLVPRDGVLPVAWSLEHVGPMGASVADVRALLTVLASPAEVRPPTRVGVCAKWWAEADQDATGAVDRALQRIGAERVDVDLPHIALAQATLAILCHAEAAAALVRFDREPLGPSVRVSLAVGRATSAQEYVEAQRIRAIISAELRSALTRCDVLVTPTTSHAARPYHDDALRDGELDEDAYRRATAFTFPANLAGLPAAQVPCGTDADGMPLGLQVIAPFGHDLDALDFAERIERATERLIPPSYRALLDAP